jgi:hypothetical protein
MLQPALLLPVCWVSPYSENLHWNFAHPRPPYRVFCWPTPTSGAITLGWPRKLCIDNDLGSTFREFRIIVVKERWGRNVDSVKWHYSSRRRSPLITTMHNLLLACMLPIYTLYTNIQSHRKDKQFKLHELNWSSVNYVLISWDTLYRFLPTKG